MTVPGPLCGPLPGLLLKERDRAGEGEREGREEEAGKKQKRVGAFEKKKKTI